MGNTKLYNQFKGYKAYPTGIAENIIRSKLTDLFDKLIGKNETCLIKAREKGMEKLLSRIMAVKKRMERIKKEMDSGDKAEYKFEKIADSDEAAIKDIDLSLEKVIINASDLIDSLTCMETDMRIFERFASMDDCLREIENLSRKRTEVFKKMRIFG